MLLNRHEMHTRHLYDKHRPYCNFNRCGHSSEVKKIYLREIAVGTDSDFPVDQPRSSIVEKSRRIAFETTANDRNTIINNRAVVNNNNNRYINNYQSPRRGNFCDVQNNNERDTRIWRRFGNNYNGNVIDKMRNKQQNSNRMQSDSEENDEYTPVPVKQLIQEFEKTCRPVLQYKQISPKIIPIVQQCSVDNDIARFFETRNSAKYNNEEECARARECYEGFTKQSSQCNGQLYNPRKGYERSAKLQQPQCNSQLYNIYESYEEANSKLPAQYNNGYASTDESEYTTDDTDSEVNEYQDAKSIDRGNSAPSALLSCCDNDYSIAFEDECSRQRRSTTSLELEDLYANANSDSRFINTEIPAQAKSLMLSMVTSQQDILETKKHLRNTPVLDNLLGTATPECKFNDVNLELGNKLYENNNYTGPKLASLHNLTNYNTAPRGWDQSLPFYRPIKFEKPQEILYSDF